MQDSSETAQEQPSRLSAEGTPPTQTPLDQKINEHFAGMVVRKDLVKAVKGNAIVPSYVLEYLLGQYAASDEEATIQSGIDTVRKILAEHYVHRNQSELVRSEIKRRDIAGQELKWVEGYERSDSMSTTKIADAERTEREHKVAEAIHSGEMEGLHTTEATKADAGKYVVGEIDLAELEDRVRARYGIL